MPARIELHGGPLDGAIIDAPPAAHTRVRVGMQQLEYKATGVCWAPEWARKFPAAIYRASGFRWVHVKTEVQ